MKKFFILQILILTTLNIFGEEFSIEALKKEVFTPKPFTFVSNYHNNENYSSTDYTFEADGYNQHVLISTPKKDMPKNGYPIIILIHGYITPQYYNTYNSYSYMFNRFSSSEFMVAKPDLRGHGRSERNANFSDNLEMQFYARDVLQLIYSLQTLPNVDTNNIFLMGHSNGGNQVIRVLVSKPNLVNAASMWGPTLATQEESNFFWYGGGKRKYGDDAIYEAEAQTTIARLKNEVTAELKKFGHDETAEDLYYTPYLKDVVTPLVIRHPDTDESVPYQWSLDFLDDFKKSGNTMEVPLINYPGDNHNIAAHQGTAQRADMDFFRANLK